MGKAKAIDVRPLAAKRAHAFVRRVHYSGTTAANSQLCLGVWLEGRLEGVMQFGPSLDKRKVQGLVAATPWNGFLELNRLAFTDALPRNSESRALGAALRLIRKHYPHVQWVISYADGTQCGDGTIYRAAGFVLTSIKRNTTIWELPGGVRMTDISIRAVRAGADLDASAPARVSQKTLTHARRPAGRRALAALGLGVAAGASSMKRFKEAGAKLLEGNQLRYLYFLDPSARVRLTVAEIPYSEIEARGAGMYRGERTQRGKQAMVDPIDTAAVQR